MTKAATTLLLLLLLACGGEQKRPATSVAGGDPARGKLAIDKYGCTACHNIPGIAGPKGAVGPSLEHIASRATLGGKVANNPETMVKWLQDPTVFNKETAMPALGVTEPDSRDITAYLYTLK